MELERFFVAGFILTHVQKYFYGRLTGGGKVEEEGGNRPHHPYGSATDFH